jgi:hypothetical protein
LGLEAMLNVVVDEVAFVTDNSNLEMAVSVLLELEPLAIVPLLVVTLTATDGLVVVDPVVFELV